MLDHPLQRLAVGGGQCFLERGDSIAAHGPLGTPEQPGHGVELTLGVGGLVDLSHAPLADEGGDVVVAESGADCEGHSDRG